MIHMGAEPFQTGVGAYSNNIGNIKSYEYNSLYGFSLKVKTEESIFYLDCNAAFARRFSCVICSYDEEEISLDELIQIKETIKKTKVKWDYEKGDWISCDYGGGTFYIIDPRPVRAFILGNYEYFKYKSARKEWSEEAQEADDKRISAFLNESIDWTIDDAKEWLTRNGFQTSDVLTEFRYTQEEEKYVPYFKKLIAPYWTPDNK